MRLQREWIANSQNKVRPTQSPVLTLRMALRRCLVQTLRMSGTEAAYVLRDPYAVSSTYVLPKAPYH